MEEANKIIITRIIHDDDKRYVENIRMQIPLVANFNFPACHSYEG
jgi:hypothetical protein